MKKFLPQVLVLLAFLVAGCSSKDDGSHELGSKEYTLHSVDKPSVMGNVTISENEDGSATVLLEINGSSTDIHPAFIYNGSETQSGSVAITLNPIECECESSTTIVTKLDNGTGITYGGLKAFNGHVKIHQSADELGIIIAQGNIGALSN